MQNVSKAYKEAMKKPLRNRAYINISIGVINQNAQKTAVINNPEKSLAYFANPTKSFNGYKPDSLYATAEQGFAKVDGSMVFLPREKSEVIFNNGLISNELYGGILISFGFSGLDIKGLTIDFGECYPTEFIIQTDNSSKTYSDNTLPRWSTEDVFLGVSYIKIIPVSFVSGANRLRIYEFLCGVGNVFTNKDIKSYSWKDYVSPISEDLPSQDMSVTVYNFSKKYNADNPDSALNFMEIGQEISVSFGYDVTGNGDIEWIDGNEAYLKSWSADDKQAKFTATDQFDNIESMYYRGKFRALGISAYDLAEDIFTDMGFEARQYVIDPYLKNVLIYNPMPVVPHVQALQILSNACRCVLFQNRSKQIQIKSSFIPDMMASSENQTAFSNVGNILNDGKRTVYAVAFNDFAKVDGSMVFLPRNVKEFSAETGYVSNSVCDELGAFATNPVVVIELESEFTCYGLSMLFNSVAPEDFSITIYNNNEITDTYEVIGNTDLEIVINYAFLNFNKMKIEFTKGRPNSRIVLDKVFFGDVTDYHLEYKYDLTGTPNGSRLHKLKSMSIMRTVYSENTEEKKQILSSDMKISQDDYLKTVYFKKASYDLEVLFAVKQEDGNTVYQSISPDGIRVEIIEESNYYAVLNFSGVSKEVTVNIVINGKEYVTNEIPYTVQHNSMGDEINWKNELISTTLQAKDLEEWLSEYYMGTMEYQLPFRGDPRVDANDLFYLELKDRDKAMVRCYQNELKYSGAWNGTLKARKVN